MKVQLTPWLDESAREMEAIFVNLEMEKDEDPHSQIKQKNFEKNEDLVTLQTDTACIKINRILIQGDTGSGKSTLLNNLAYKWALQLQRTDSWPGSDSPISNFDLVFLIRIHEIHDEHKNDSLEEIIYNRLFGKGFQDIQTWFDIIPRIKFREMFVFGRGD